MEICVFNHRHHNFYIHLFSLGIGFLGSQYLRALRSDFYKTARHQRSSSCYYNSFQCSIFGCWYLHHQLLQKTYAQFYWFEGKTADSKTNTDAVCDWLFCFLDLRVRH